MRIHDAGEGAIWLGRQGENLATRIRFDTSKITDAFGTGGTFTLLARRRTDAGPYPVVITAGENSVLWDVTEADSAIDGAGECELRYYLNEVLVKTMVWTTRVTRCIEGDDTDPPEPYETWVDQVLEAAEDAAEAAEAAEAALAAMSVDPTLTVEGSPADAKAAGDGIRGVEGVLASLTVPVTGSSDTFEDGALSSSTGANATSSRHIRTKTVLSSSCYAVECASGWSAAYYAFDGGTYIGCWDKSTGTFTTTRTFNNGLVYLSNISTSYTFKLVVRKNDNDYITTDTAAPNVTLWSRTDTSLSMSGTIADAKAVGDRFAAMEETTGSRFSALEESTGYRAWEAATPISDNMLDNNYTRLGYTVSSSGVSETSTAEIGLSNLIPVRGGVAYNYDMQMTTFGSTGKRVAFYPETVTEEDAVDEGYTVRTATEIVTNRVFQIIPPSNGYIRINRKSTWTDQWFGAASALAASTAEAMSDTTKDYVYIGSETGYTAGHKYVWDSDASAWTDAGSYVYKTCKAHYVPKPGAFINSVANPLYGKKIACDGDSVMKGNESYQGGYIKMIALDNDMYYKNNAVGGATITYGTTSSSGNRHWISGSIGSLPEGYDYYIFNGGLNDIDLSAVRATFDETYFDRYNYDLDTLLSDSAIGHLDRTKFCQAFEYCCAMMSTDKFATAKRGYVFSHRHVDTTWRAAWDDTWKPFMEKCLKKWGIPYLDLEQVDPPLGQIPALYDVYTKNGDRTHPTEEGYRIFYVDQITAWLRTL